jgi:hypothetical protein
MVLPGWVAEVCGYAGTAGFILMLTPQIVLNARKRSTEGLSMGLVLLWHSAAVLSTAFYITRQPLNLAPVLSVAVFALSSAILEGQIVAFDPTRAEKTAWPRSAVLAGVTALSSALSVGLVAAVACLLDVLPPPFAADAIGDVLPTLLLALGFLPQFREFLQNWSIEGYSFGITFFDVTGSVGNTVAQLASPGSSLGTALVNSLPFLLIIAMHCVLLVIAAVITCRPRASKAEPSAVVEP